MKIVVHVNSALKGFIPEFLDSLGSSSAAMREALLKRDYETIRFQGHQLKGTGGGFGFHDISAFGAQLEQAARDEDSHEIETQLDRLASYIDCVEVIYESDEPAESR